MKNIIVFSIVASIGVASSSAAPRKIAFERADGVWTTNVDGSGAKKIAAGVLPDISQDGTRVAFNTEADPKTRPGPERHIAIADLANGKVTVLKDIPSDNCLGPVWSPDGKQLVFMIMADQKWQLGMVNADGSGFRLIRITDINNDGLGGTDWSRDGKTIFCHDLDNLYQIDLDGKITNKWALSKILTEASMNSNDRLSVSPDGTKILMDVDLGAEHERKNWDGPQPAVFLFDPATEKSTRVTGKNDFVWEPSWLSNDRFLCLIQKENEKDPSLYQMDLNGKNAKLIAKHARTPSVSAP